MKIEVQDPRFNKTIIFEDGIPASWEKPYWIISDADNVAILNISKDDLRRIGQAI